MHVMLNRDMLENAKVHRCIYMFLTNIKVSSKYGTGKFLISTKMLSKIGSTVCIDSNPKKKNNKVNYSRVLKSDRSALNICVCITCYCLHVHFHAKNNCRQPCTKDNTIL